MFVKHVDLPTKKEYGLRNVNNFVPSIMPVYWRLQVMLFK